MRISVIIPHYQNLPALDQCLEALVKQSCARRDFEIIVADNDSPVGEAAVRACIRDRAQLVVAQKPGAGPARNEGVRAASGEILAFIDCDCIPEPDWLAAGAAALNKADIVGGLVRVSVEDTFYPTPTEAFEAAFAFDFETYIKKKGFTGSGNMFVSADIFRMVGGFSVGVSEDVEWCHRARELGFTLAYEKSAVVWHPARRSWAELKTKWRRVLSEQFNLYCDQPYGRMIWLIRGWATPASAIVHTAKVLRHPELPSLRAKFGALAVLYRLRFWRFIEVHRLLLGGRS